MEATRRMSEAAAGPRQSLSDFLQRRSLADARSSIFHSFDRRQSRAGEIDAPAAPPLLLYIHCIQ